MSICALSACQTYSPYGSAYACAPIETVRSVVEQVAVCVITSAGSAESGNVAVRPAGERSSVASW